VEVLLVSTDDATGEILLSRREVPRMRAWAEVTARYREGDRVQGTVRRVVKGGLLVDIGIPAFLPTSQIDIRRPTNLEDYFGHSLECFIVRIDEARRRIILSRRRLFVHEDPMINRAQLATMEAGQVRVGIVKNIADFGVFADLGGIDGLLLVKEMSWGPPIDPRQMVTLDQRLEVVLLQVDPERAKISLGLRHRRIPANWLTPSVLGVARGIAETNDAAGFPILADALEDAGCEDAALLSHLRGPHPRTWGDALIASLTAVDPL
jgi:small subunit ribosomal protein S1